MATTPTTATGEPRPVERQKMEWIVKDQPGAMRYVDKHDLKIDPSYQRSLTESKVMIIRKGWSWKACGALQVAHRQDDTLWVMDGGHRLAAAMKRSDIDTLPCIIFEVAGSKEEARGFLDINTQRKPLNSAHKFRALLALDDPHAVFVNRLINYSGRRPGDASTPTTVSCLSGMLKLAKSNKDTLLAVWPIISQLCEGRVIHSHLLFGLEHLERHLREHDDSLMEDRWQARLTKLGSDALLKAADAAAGFYGRGSPPTWAQGIINVLNTGMRNRIPTIEITEHRGFKKQAEISE